MKAVRATMVLTRDGVNRRLVTLAAIQAVLEFSGNAAEGYASRATRVVVRVCAMVIGMVTMIISERHKVRRGP